VLAGTLIINPSPDAPLRFLGAASTKLATTANNTRTEPLNDEVNILLIQNKKKQKTT
jgi:hypothetical protein